MLLAQFDRRCQSDWQMLPVDQVTRPGMAPVHETPLIAKRIVLIKEVEPAAVEDRAVRVVHPFRWWGEMVRWAARICYYSDGSSSDVSQGTGRGGGFHAHEHNRDQSI